MESTKEMMTFEDYTEYEEEELRKHEKDIEDKVNSPSHYTNGSIESLVYIEDMLTDQEYIGFLRGNISKYLHRYKYKNGVEDLRKAQFYLARLIDKME